MLCSSKTNIFPKAPGFKGSKYPDPHNGHALKFPSPFSGGCHTTAQSLPASPSGNSSRREPRRGASPCEGGRSGVSHLRPSARGCRAEGARLPQHLPHRRGPNPAGHRCMPAEPGPRPPRTDTKAAPTLMMLLRRGMPDLPSRCWLPPQPLSQPGLPGAAAASSSPAPPRAQSPLETPLLRQDLLPPPPPSPSPALKATFPWTAPGDAGCPAPPLPAPRLPSSAIGLGSAPLRSAPRGRGRGRGRLLFRFLRLRAGRGGCAGLRAAGGGAGSAAALRHLGNEEKRNVTVCPPRLARAAPRWGRGRRARTHTHTRARAAGAPRGTLCTARPRGAGLTGAGGTAPPLEPPGASPSPPPATFPTRYPAPHATFPPARPGPARTSLQPRRPRMRRSAPRPGLHPRGKPAGGDAGARRPQPSPAPGRAAANRRAPRGPGGRRAAARSWART